MKDTPEQSQDAAAVDEGRRRFCQVTIGGMTVASAATVGYPIITFLNLPISMTPEESIELAMEDLSGDAAIWREKMGQQIVIIRTADGPLAFNGACPHLGCVVQWDVPSRTFKCPCHGAEFNDKGEPVAGPVNTPLEPVAFEIEDGVLTIT